MAIHIKSVRKWTRDELEDAYLRLYDESQEFRRVIADQNIKIKMLNTKIMRITADNKKFADVYAKADEDVTRENQQTKKDKELPLDKSATLMRNLKRQNVRNSALEQAIKLLNNQNMQMKSRIAELESVVENQNKIICEKTEAENSSKQRDAFAENVELIRLKRQLIEKDKNIENLTSQLVSTGEDLKSVGAEECNIQEREIQLGSGGSNELQVKLCFLENQVAECERENKVLRESNEQVLKSLMAWRSDPKTVDLLLEKLQHLERKMSASRGDREKQYEEMSRIHNTLQARAQSAEAQIEALSRRLEENQPSRNLQELCESIGLDVKDLEAALIQMSGRREYLIEGVDAGVHLQASKTPQREAISYPTESVHVEAAEKLPTTQHRVAEEHQRAVENTKGQFNSTRIRTVTRPLEPGSSQIMGLGSRLVLPITKFIPDESSSFGEGENLFEINLGEINLTPDQLEACPNGVFCIWRFYNFEAQSTDIVRGRRSNFNLTVQYPVIMDELFWTYLHEKHCSMELHKVLPDLSSQEIGEFELDLQYLLRPESYESTNVGSTARHSVQVSRVGRFRASKKCREVEGEQQEKQRSVGQVVYWMGFRAPIEYSLRRYLKRHRRRSRRKDLDEASSRESTQRRKRQLSIGLSVEEFAPQVDFCFAYTFWRCPEYVSSVYKAPATDIRLITLKTSPQLDRYLQSSSLAVLLIEGKSGSCLGVAEVPLLGLAESGGSVNGTFQVHHQPSKSPKIPPIGVTMQWNSVTTADTRRASERKHVEKRVATEATATP